jgi:hypothetical protein
MESNGMILTHLENINEALFAGKIKKRNNHINPSPGIINFVFGTSVVTSTTSNFQLQLQKGQFLMLDGAYLQIQTKVTAATQTGSVATYLIPNFITFMMQNISLNADNFSFSAQNYNSNKSLSMVASVFRLRSYTPNQLALVALRENLLFASTDPSSSAITLNPGFKVANAFATATLTTSKYYNFQLPINCLLPIINKVKLVSGTITMTIGWSYLNNIYSNGAFKHGITGSANPVLATITEFIFNQINFVYDVIDTYSSDSIDNIERITSIQMIRYPLTPVNPLTVPASTGAITQTTAITSMNSASMPVRGKPLSLIILPYIETQTGGVLEFANLLDIGIPANALIQSDNFSQANINTILSPCLTVNNLRVISGTGVTYPSNNPLILNLDSTGDSYNYQNSFVQVYGNNPSGETSNSALTFNQYKNYFKPMVIDVSNEGFDTYSGGSSFTVTFDIGLADNVFNNNVTTSLGFSGDVYVISAVPLTQ